MPAYTMADAPSFTWRTWPIGQEWEGLRSTKIRGAL